jgi:YVTN family beta-propeller protein
LGVTVTPDGDYLYVANHLDDSVCVIQTSNHTVLSPAVPVGVGPIGLAASPDGEKIFVSNFVDGSLSIIATSTTHMITETIAVGHGPRGIGLCEGPDEPVIEKLRPETCDVGEVIKIIGNNFGDVQRDSVVHIGNDTFDASSPSIRLWTNTKIRLEVPVYDCKWFKSRNLRRMWVWVTVFGADSNEERLKIVKPAACACECDLNGDGLCDNSDLNLFIGDWGRLGCRNGSEICECDLNADGVCDSSDWEVFYEDWERSECR